MVRRATLSVPERFSHEPACLPVHSRSRVRVTEVNLYDKDAAIPLSDADGRYARRYRALPQIHGSKRAFSGGMTSAPATFQLRTFYVDGGSRSGAIGGSESLRPVVRALPRRAPGSVMPAEIVADGVPRRIPTVPRAPPEGADGSSARPSAWLRTGGVGGELGARDATLRLFS